jgi:NAD(P)H-flavin reductase
MLQNGVTRKMDLIFGVRHEDDLFWKDELRAIAQEYPNFFLHIALSGGSDAWAGHRGRVQTLVHLVAPDIANRSVYVCGSPDMTKEVKALCLDEWHVEKKDLHVEGYI